MCNYLVSIITPAYNAGKYIEECITSVINQTYENWEMIIVNDKSTDNTVEMVQKYIEKDSRIKLYNQEKNSGVALARNKSIELSSGRFIAFLDSDDMWKSNKLEEQISFMLKNNYAFTFTAYEIYKGNLNPKIISVPKSVTYRQYLKNTIIGCLTVIMDKELLGDVRVELGNLEDVLTWMRYLKSGHKAHGLSQNLASYRVTENSVSGNKLKNAKRYYRLLRDNQNLSFVQSAYCFTFYTINATLKRLF